MVATEGSFKTVLFDFLTALHKIFMSTYSFKHVMNIILVVPGQDLKRSIKKLIKWLVMSTHDVSLRLMLLDKFIIKNSLYSN
jgi:hypothetical protein